MEAIRLNCLGCGHTLPPQLGLVVCERCGQVHWVGPTGAKRLAPNVSIVPSLKAVAVLFLTKTLTGNETADEAASLWRDVAHRRNMCEIHARNAEQRRAQVASYGKNYAPPYMINDLADQVAGVSAYIAELAKSLGVEEDALFTPVEEETFESAKDALFLLCLKPLDYELEKARKALKKALGLPESWFGGAQDAAM